MKKTKIEKVIREHNEMWAAFQTLNKKIKDGVSLNSKREANGIAPLKMNRQDFLNAYSDIKVGDIIEVTITEKPKPKFKVGDWFVPHIPNASELAANGWAFELLKFNNILLQVSEISPPYLTVCKDGSRVYFHPDWCEKVEIVKSEIKSCRNCGLARVCKSLTVNGICKDWIAIPEMNQPKPPVIGEMAIMWDSRKSEAICAIFGDKENGLYYCNMGKPHYNAILYESPEQYKEFLKS